jgi:hypothetical protein
MVGANLEHHTSKVQRIVLKPGHVHRLTLVF